VVEYADYKVTKQSNFSNFSICSMLIFFLGPHTKSSMLFFFLGPTQKVNRTTQGKSQKEVRKQFDVFKN
jgi:hypothetical protein